MVDPQLCGCRGARAQRVRQWESVRSRVFIVDELEPDTILLVGHSLGGAPLRSPAEIVAQYQHDGRGDHLWGPRCGNLTYIQGVANTVKSDTCRARLRRRAVNPAPVHVIWYF
jgi:pimeloyl-ACP methyl ester carboxylesterase